MRIDPIDVFAPTALLDGDALLGETAYVVALARGEHVPIGVLGIREREYVRAIDLAVAMQVAGSRRARACGGRRLGLSGRKGIGGQPVGTSLRLEVLQRRRKGIGSVR